MAQDRLPRCALRYVDDRLAEDRLGRRGGHNWHLIGRTGIIMLFGIYGS